MGRSWAPLCICRTFFEAPEGCVPMWFPLCRRRSNDLPNRKCDVRKNELSERTASHIHKP